MGKRKNKHHWEIRMDILEKKNLLCLVIVSGMGVSICLADSTQYFDSKVDYFAQPKEVCASCQAQDSMNKSVDKVVSTIKVNSLPNGVTGEIDLYIDSSCRFSDLAIKNLSAFVQAHNAFVIKVVVFGPIREFMGVGKQLAQSHPGWSVMNDLTGDNAKILGVLKVPAYIFTNKGRMYRIYGTPDLEDTWSKINATAQ